MTNDEHLLIGAIAAPKPPMGEGPEYEGIAKTFWPVVEAHGREMLQAVFAAGVAGHCAQLLGNGLRGQLNAMNAVNTLVEQFNILALQNIAAHGWTTDELEACDRQIRRAVDTKIILPGRGGIVLDS